MSSKNAELKSSQLQSQLDEANIRIETLQRRLDDLHRDKADLLQQCTDLSNEFEARIAIHNIEKKQWEERKMELEKEEQIKSNRIEQLEDKLFRCEVIKQTSMQNSQAEIDRLSYVINSLLQVESCRELTESLVEETNRKHPDKKKGDE